MSHVSDNSTNDRVMVSQTDNKTVEWDLLALLQFRFARDRREFRVKRKSHLRTCMNEFKKRTKPLSFYAIDRKLPTQRV